MLTGVIEYSIMDTKASNSKLFIFIIPNSALLLITN